MIILGLTGSIGMGKSTAAKMLRAMRVPVYCADEAVHELLGAGGAAVTKVAKIFPKAVRTVRSKKMIDRKILGAAAFHDKTLMKKLEKILHPLTRKMEKEFLAKAKKSNKKLVILDIPLLYETGGESRVHGVIVVTASAKIQRERVLKRSNMTAARLKEILKKQMPDKEKRRRADVVIDTGRGLAHTKATLKKLVQSLTQTQ